MILRRLICRLIAAIYRDLVPRSLFDGLKEEHRRLLSHTTKELQKAEKKTLLAQARQAESEHRLAKDCALADELFQRMQFLATTPYRVTDRRELGVQIVMSEDQVRHMFQYGDTRGLTDYAVSMFARDLRRHLDATDWTRIDEMRLVPRAEDQQSSPEANWRRK